MSGNTVITDGAKSFTAKVDEMRRLWTRAVTISTGLNAAINDDEYNVTIETLELTTDGESVLLYLRNDEIEDVDWAVTQITVTGAASDGSDDWLAALYTNVNTGTIIDTGTDININPFKLGSTKPLLATALRGFEGAVLDGTTVVDRLVPLAPAAFTIPLDALVLPPGTSMGLSVTPPTGNTSMKVQIGVVVIRLTEED